MKKRIEQLIDEALRKEPTFQLRKDFKDRVIQAIRKKEKASQRKLYMWMALGTLIIIGFGYGVISYFLPSMMESFQGFNGSSQIIPLAVLIGVIVIVIQFLDKRLVKDKMLTPNM
jgi:ABC-type Na+ efflux pump permease subunit